MTFQNCSETSEPRKIFFFTCHQLVRGVKNITVKRRRTCCCNHLFVDHMLVWFFHICNECLLILFLFLILLGENFCKDAIAWKIKKIYVPDERVRNASLTFTPMDMEGSVREQRPKERTINMLRRNKSSKMMLLHGCFLSSCW